MDNKITILSACGCTPVRACSIAHQILLVYCGQRAEAPAPNRAHMGASKPSYKAPDSALASALINAFLKRASC